MGWRVRTAWWILLCFRHSKLFQIHHQKARNTDKPPDQIYVNKILNRVTFTAQNEVLCSDSILNRVLSSALNTRGYAEEKITKDKNDQTAPQLEITEMVLVHGNIVNNQYQQDSKVWSTFFPSNSFGQLLIISPTNHIYTETFYLEFSYWSKLCVPRHRRQ